MRWLLSGFFEALHALGANKFRTFLTMLGIVIGVGAIVAVVSIGDSGKQRVVDEMERISQPTMVWCYPDWVYVQKLRQEKKPIKFLRYEQLMQVAERCAPYGTVTARESERHRIHYAGREVRGYISGVTKDYFRATNLRLREGRWITAADEMWKKRVCILGEDIHQELFGDQPALGEVIRAGGQRYAVIGVLAPKGTSFMETRSFDNRAYIPLNTHRSRNPDEDEIHWFIGIADSIELIPIFRQRIHQALVEVGLPREMMQTRSLEEEKSGFERVTLILRAVIASVAAISLLVGGLGIMNVMLVTVKERTREIGLRKAIGATSTGIRLQFFLESVSIGLLGGIIGATLGACVTYAANQILNFPMLISVGAMFWGIFFSIFVGLVFGIYPAHQAALLDPAEALRYE